jgi:hypothetical protein
MAKDLICSACGTVGAAQSVTKGSLLIEIVLWLCFLIPGVFYSIWRLSSRHKACAACGSQNLIPLDSPVGKQLQSKYGSS